MLAHKNAIFLPSFSIAESEQALWIISKLAGLSLAAEDQSAAFILNIALASG